MPEPFKEEFEKDIDDMRVYKARGCPDCRGGYKGRTVIAEILEFDQNVRDMVATGRLDQLKAAQKENSLTLRQDVTRLIRAGVTSLEEAERIVG